MRLVWDHQAHYRAFHAASVAKVVVVSSHLAEEAHGRTIGDTLLIVADSDDRFCDLELKLDPRFRSAQVPEPDAPSLCEGSLEVEIGDYDKVDWELDEVRGYLRVALRSVAPTKWLRLGSSGMVLGLNDTGYLAALVFEGVDEDPSGEKESRFLEEIEKAR